MSIAGDSRKVPGPLVRRTMSQSSNAKTGDNSVIAVSRIVYSWGVILVTALKQYDGDHAEAVSGGGPMLTDLPAWFGRIK
jgi:hypothetical protein